MTDYERRSKPRSADLKESTTTRFPWFLVAFSWFLFLTGLLLPDAFNSLRIWLLFVALASFLLCWYLYFSDIQIWDDYLMRRSRSAEVLSDIEREMQYIRDFVSQQRQKQKRQEDDFRDFLREFERGRASEHSAGFEHTSKRHDAKGTAYHHQPRSKYDEALSVLGLERGFSQTDLKKAWKKKAFGTHPDHGGSNEKFQKVTDAYNFLKE